MASRIQADHKHGIIQPIIDACRRHGIAYVMAKKHTPDRIKSALDAIAPITER